MMKPSLYVIAGSNGAGKTTFAREFLPHFAKCEEFVNMDLIASGLAPFAPRTAAIEAGRIMLKRLRGLLAQRRTFAFETTLAGRHHGRFLRQAKSAGYSVTIIYLWIPGVELALERIRERVKRGGHHVDDADVRRRFGRSLRHFFGPYRLLADVTILFDNSQSQPRLITHEGHGRRKIWDIAAWEHIQRQVEGTDE